MTASVVPIGVLGVATRSGSSSVRREITAEDALWLARSLTGEGGRSHRAERLALIGTMFRGWLLSGRSSFGEWLQAFSQPINPRWLPGAARFQRHVDGLRNGTISQSQAGLVSAAAVARRRRFRALPWSSIAPSVRADVVAALTGEFGELPGKSHNFGGPLLYRRHGLRTSNRQARKRTAPRAVARRENARRGASYGARYEEHEGQTARGNVFHSSARSRAHTYAVAKGPNPNVLPAPPAEPFGNAHTPRARVTAITAAAVACGAVIAARAA